MKKWHFFVLVAAVLLAGFLGGIVGNQIHSATACQQLGRTYEQEKAVLEEFKQRMDQDYDTSNAGDTYTARSWQVLSNNGELRGFFSYSPSFNSVDLFMMDEMGNIRTVLTVDPKYGHYIKLYDANGRVSFYAP